ncbi:tRNA (adenosine(37)-N6)-threonylcarbamoyltransferase complex ATPase subunit type 1 TsaE [Rubrimonas cliftonensis]|uniref:tRNA threonylcarbamoyladenosine biosynthesis protein TsaE n=1 Tax=Rubrimonas cliftonensis TaxID=89524 RepID=A0A1H4E365_9RHOB|nr:tRNA (adenosine(37)-N6)-threonylcarbamoyltransferase complex ATPase subunit type 1 TsaE [Rubrimonas cliftonensis]SEA79257.1 tRNA threonylcarbamoyladenosine biosynthesis protein TsaE [Rubrimonas cliftonensis]
MHPSQAPAQPGRDLRLHLPDPAATDRVGAALGLALRPGDAVLLRGGLGAGKSALARAAIAARLARSGAVEDIPSPTWTLAQIYEAEGGQIWHADLYRLGAPEEAFELGLTEAFETAVCFVEWPERLGALLPARALDAALEFDGEGRSLAIAAHGEGWAEALAALAAAA